jgi:glycosyltransferase involved in cell wall biosynthesis
MVRLRRRRVVILGIWHPVFFVDAALGVLGLVSGGRVLIPTQSLSPIDWRKHEAVKKLLEPLVVAALRRYERVIFASHGEREVARPPLPADQGRVVYHPIASSLVGRTAQRVLRRRAVFLARLHPQKDPKLFLAAAALLPDDWHVDIIGDGEAAFVSDLRAGVPDSLAARTTWHGWVSQEEAHRVLGDGSVLIVTSHDENYCHAAVEAMAIGVPVLAVDRIAIAVDFRLNGTAMLCRAAAGEIAAAACQLTASDDVRLSLVERGFEFARARREGNDRRTIVELVAAGD